MTNKKDFEHMVKEFTQPYSPKTYEQFVLEEQQNPNREQSIADSYEVEFDASNSIGTSKGYGPCPDQYYSDSSGNYVKITVSGNSANNEIAKQKEAKRRAWDTGYSAAREPKRNTDYYSAGEK